MIPKIIHYCWFSDDPYPEKISQCIASWTKYCPSYELHQWHKIDELIEKYPFVREAYHAKKWAFVTDFVRLYALCTEGGFYFDSDVELLGSPDLWLNEKAFCGTEVIQIPGQTVRINPEPAVMGAEKDCQLLVGVLEYYQRRHFYLGFGNFDETPMPEVITPFWEKDGYVHKDELQVLNCGMRVFPSTEITNVTYPQNSAIALHRITHSWKNDGGRVFSFCKKNKLMFLYRLYSHLKKNK